MSKYLAQWREKLEATEEIQLSIGPAVIRSHVSLLDLAAAGHIPAALLVELDEIGAKARKNPQQAGIDNLTKLTPALDALAIAAFVDPPLSKTGDADSLAVSIIPFADKLILLDRLTQEVEPLRTFLPENGQSNGTAPVSDELPLPAIGDTGNPG